MKTLALALGLSLLGIGCNTSPVPVHTFHVSTELSPSQMDAVVSAQDEWRIATDGAADVEIVIGGRAGDGEGRILLSTPGEATPCGPAGNWGCIHRYDRNDSPFGTDRNWTEDLYIAPDEPESEFRTTVLHELGHHHGIREHLPETPSPVVMSAYDSPRHLTLTDVNTFMQYTGRRPVSTVPGADSFATEPDSAPSTTVRLVNCDYTL